MVSANDALVLYICRSIVPGDFADHAAERFLLQRRSRSMRDRRGSPGGAESFDFDSEKSIRELTAEILCAAVHELLILFEEGKV